MEIYIALDCDGIILGAYANRADAANICEIDWLAAGGKRGGFHWDDDDLINTAYATSVRSIKTEVLQ